MKNKIEGKHIRHAPVRKFKQDDSNYSFYFKSSTPVVSAVKKIDKKLAKLTGNKRYISVFAMGRSINNACKLSVNYQERSFRVDVLTGTTTLLDEFEVKDEENVLKKRSISHIELRVWKK